MSALRKFTWIVCLGCAIAVGVLGCGSTSSDSHPGQGIVKAIDPDARQVTLDHDEIPGFMKGMTMTFDVGPEVLLEGIDPGAEVDFRVKNNGGVTTVTEIRHSGFREKDHRAAVRSTGSAETGANQR